MLAALSALGDDDMIRRVLADVVPSGGHDPRDADAILGALGCLPPPERAALVERIVQGTAGTAFAACAGLLARAAASGPAGLHGAAAALVEAMPGDPARAAPAPAWQLPAPVTPRAVLDLMAGLGAVDPALAEQAAAYMLAWPGTYGMDAVLIPAARELSAGAPGAGVLRAACLAHLSARAAEPLSPPADWRRDSTLPCRCTRCTELARFLDDSEQRTWVLKAARGRPQPRRGHDPHSGMRPGHGDGPPRPALQPGLHQDAGQLRAPSQAAQAGFGGPDAADGLKRREA